MYGIEDGSPGLDRPISNSCLQSLVPEATVILARASQNKAIYNTPLFMSPISLRDGKAISIQSFSFTFTTKYVSVTFLGISN